MEGFIKLHRKLKEWEWYSDHNMTRMFIHLLLSANHAPRTWQGQHIERGQLVTSLSNISAEAGFTQKQSRGLFNRLKKTGEITCKGTNRFTVVTLCNYDTYQSRESEKGTQEGNQQGTQKDKQRANKGQTKGKQRATNKNEKNVKNEKNDKKRGVSRSDLLISFQAELERLERPMAEIIVLANTYERWIDYRGAKKFPVNVEMVKRDAGRCCGIRGQRKIYTPPRDPIATTPLIEALEAAMCQEWRDWFFDEDMAKRLSGAENENPPREDWADNPFGN